MISNTLIVSGAIILFIIILLIANHKIISLFFIKFFFGKYSYKYTAYHKAKFIKNPHPPCIKDDLMNHCVRFVEFDTNASNFETNQIIQFGGFEFYTSFKVINGKEKADCFSIYKLDNNIIAKAVGFKKEVFGNDIREVYFFINDVFFMGEYAFSDVSRMNNDKLVQMLKTKYGIQKEITSDTFYIQDKNKSIIFFENNGFNISIKYINLTEPIINQAWESFFKNAYKKEAFYTNEGDREIFSKL